MHGTALVDLVVKLVLPFLRQSTTVSHSKHEALHASLYLLNQDSYHRPHHVLLQLSVVRLLNLVLCEWQLDILLLVLAEAEHQVVVPAKNS